MFPQTGRRTERKCALMVQMSEKFRTRNHLSHTMRDSVMNSVKLLYLSSILCHTVPNPKKISWWNNMALWILMFQVL